jgi:hypothetical protein
VNFLEPPDGFSAFICFPQAQVRDKTQAELEHFYQVLFGNDELSGDKMKTLTKSEWFLPTSCYETLEQLTVTICLLEQLTQVRGLASDGYRFGKSLLVQYGAQFNARQREDPLFMVKFVHLLDAVFQTFLEKIYRYAKLVDPLVEAKKKDLHLFQERTIESGLGNFLSLGHIPPLSLPRSLERYKKGGKSDPGKKGDGVEKEKPLARGGGAKTDKPVLGVGLVDNPDKC